MHCEGCGNDKAYRQLVFWVETKDENLNVIRRDKVEVCNECSHGEDKPAYPRDAAGNRVSIPTADLGRFSYATGTPMTSARQYANELRRLGLQQKEV